MCALAEELAALLVSEAECGQRSVNGTAVPSLPTWGPQSANSWGRQEVSSIFTGYASVPNASELAEKYAI